MSSFWAIVLDTWRQSRQQAVFIIMLIVLAVVAIGTIVVPSPYEQPDGSTRIGFVWADEPSGALEGAWIDSYAQTLILEDTDDLSNRSR